MKWKTDQSLARYAEEYKAKYLQYKCEENPQLGMMGSFLASLDETIRRMVWEREKLFEMMMELLDIVIRLGDARELGRQSQQVGNKMLEKTFASGRVVRQRTSSTNTSMNRRKILRAAEARMSPKRRLGRSTPSLRRTKELVSSVARRITLQRTIPTKQK